MAACETCWRRAQYDVMLLGGSVSNWYRQRLAEQCDHPTHEPTTAADTEEA